MGNPSPVGGSCFEWLRAGWGIARSPWAPLTLETLEDLYLPWDPTDGLQHDGGSLWVLHTQAVLPPVDTGLTVPSGHTYSPPCTHHHPHRRWYVPAEEVFHILQKTWKKADWQGLWCSQAPHVDIWPEELEGLYVLPQPHLQSLENNPALAMHSIISLACPGLLFPITVDEDPGELSSS